MREFSHAFVSKQSRDHEDDRRTLWKRSLREVTKINARATNGEALRIGNSNTTRRERAAIILILEQHAVRIVKRTSVEMRGDESKHTRLHATRGEGVSKAGDHRDDARNASSACSWNRVKHRLWICCEDCVKRARTKEFTPVRDCSAILERVDRRSLQWTEHALCAACADFAHDRIVAYFFTMRRRKHDLVACLNECSEKRATESNDSVADACDDADASHGCTVSRNGVRGVLRGVQRACIT